MGDKRKNYIYITLKSYTFIQKINKKSSNLEYIGKQEKNVLAGCIWRGAGSGLNVCTAAQAIKLTLRRIRKTENLKL